MNNLLNDYTEMKNKKIINVWLKQNMKIYKIKVTEIADLLKVTRQQIYRYLNNKDKINYEKYVILNDYMKNKSKN